MLGAWHRLFRQKLASSLSRRLPKRFYQVSAFGKVVLAKPATRLEIVHPPEVGYFPRAAWPEKKTIEGVSLASLRRAVLVPGGIISRGTKLHVESFPDRSKYSTSRYIKKKRDNPFNYFTCPSWHNSAISARVKEGFFLDGDYVDHYGHFITEALPRLWAALEYRPLSEVAVITSSTSIPLVRFFSGCARPVFHAH